MKPALYGALNIASATGIVFANKAVLSVYGFEFATALTLLHTLTTVLGMMLFCQLGMFTPKQVPALQVRQALLFFFLQNLHGSTLFLASCLKGSFCLHAHTCALLGFIASCMLVIPAPKMTTVHFLLDAVVVTDRWLHWQQHMLGMLF